MATMGFSPLSVAMVNGVKGLRPLNVLAAIDVE